MPKVLLPNVVDHFIPKYRFNWDDRTQSTKDRAVGRAVPLVEAAFRRAAMIPLIMPSNLHLQTIWTGAAIFTAPAQVKTIDAGLEALGVYNDPDVAQAIYDISAGWYGQNSRPEYY